MPCTACGIMQPVQSRAPAQGTLETLDRPAFGFEHLKPSNRACRDGPRSMNDDQRTHQYLQSKVPAGIQAVPDRALCSSLRVFSMSHWRPLPDLRTGKGLQDAALDRGVCLRVGPADQPTFVPGGNAQTIPRHVDLLIRRGFAPPNAMICAHASSVLSGRILRWQHRPSVGSGTSGISTRRTLFGRMGSIDQQVCSRPKRRCGMGDRRLRDQGHVVAWLPAAVCETIKASMSSRRVSCL